MSEWSGPARESVDPSGWGWLRELLGRVERRLSDLETRAPLRNAELGTEGIIRILGSLLVEGGGGITVDDGGNVTLQGGGTMQVLGGSQIAAENASGQEVVRVGLQPLGDYGLRITREDGTRALVVAKPLTVDDDQLVQFYDKNGAVILSDNFIGDGLERPSLELPLRPCGPAASTVAVGPYGWERAVSSTSWTDVFRYDGRRQNYFYDVGFMARSSDGATTGEVRVVDRLNADSVLNGFFQPPWVGSITGAMLTDTDLTPPYQLIQPGTYDAAMSLVVQARRTAGAGSVTVMPTKSLGGAGDPLA